MSRYETTGYVKSEKLKMCRWTLAQARHSCTKRDVENDKSQLTFGESGVADRKGTGALPIGESEGLPLLNDVVPFFC